MAIVCADTWQGTANNGKWDNHESSLSKDEMIALAGTIPGLFTTDPLPPGTPQCFIDLAESFKSGTVTITKGIHQRDSKVHFDVTGSKGVTRGTFHVFVVPGVDKIAVSPKIGWGAPKLTGKTVERTLFAYAVSGLSYRVGAMDHLFPAVFAQLADLEKPLGRPRGKSFSAGNSNAVPTNSERETLLATL